MSRLFYAWEFGANLGHIAAFLPLARALRDQGHTVDWAVTQTGPAARLLNREGFTWLQAPVVAEVKRPGPPITYADILLRFGYADADDLMGLVVAWRELFRMKQAKLILADHAPTAVLGARTLDIPVMLFSNGFTVPPRIRPLPNMRPWQAIPDADLLALEDTALASVNTVLGRFGLPALDALWKIFDVAEETMVTYPELDHYENRGPARYWGSLPNAAIGIAPPWPDLPGKRIFAYLRPETPNCECALDALRDLGLPTVAYVPGANQQALGKWAARHLVFAQAPVDLSRAAAEADVAVTYASLATSTAFLFAGKPLLMLPSHLEQFLFGRRVAELGAGVLVNPEQPPGDLRAPLLGLVGQPAYRENAQAFAKKYAAFPQDQVIGNLVRRIGEICAAQQGTET